MKFPNTPREFYWQWGKKAFLSDFLSRLGIARTIGYLFGLAVVVLNITRPQLIPLWVGSVDFLATVIPLLVFVLLAILIPPYTIYIQRHKQALDNEKRLLTLEAIPTSIEIRFEPREPYLTSEGSPSERWARIEVYNRGPAAAEHVQVLLVNVTPAIPLLEAILPCRLGVRGGGKEARINPETEEYFDVAVARDVPEGQRLLMKFHTVHDSGHHLLGHLIYQGVLKATASNMGPTDEYSFTLQERNGALSFIWSGKKT